MGRTFDRSAGDSCPKHCDGFLSNIIATSTLQLKKESPKRSPPKKESLKKESPKKESKHHRKTNKEPPTKEPPKSLRAALPNLGNSCGFHGGDTLRDTGRGR